MDSQLPTHRRPTVSLPAPRNQLTTRPVISAPPGGHPPSTEQAAAGVVDGHRRELPAGSFRV
ncbi:hypothetical protein ACIG87_12940 [Micromonospora sp. NPDC051925]|uniref:hypothetical protein n=1 Tax=Micromonospora sp. NPDC051925 TaxID=3364288 RepID=UPI0037CBB886